MTGLRSHVRRLCILFFSGVLAPLTTSASDFSLKVEPGAVFRDCAECPELVVIPTGTFRMGFEGGINEDRTDAPPINEDRYDGPIHSVTIERPFALGRYEVTVEEYARFVAETGYKAATDCGIWAPPFVLEPVPGTSWRDPAYDYPPHPRDPAGCLTWPDAKAYVSWLAEKTGYAYRLPSEAEWEYAAQAGSDSTYPWGEDINAACDYANVFDLAAKDERPWQPVTCNDGFATIAKVGSLKPNAFGLFDMVGNVYEWTEDCYVRPYGIQPVDGSPFQVDGECKDRTIRGAGWQSAQRYMRPSFRGRDVPDMVSQIYGLRVARDLN